MALNYLGSFTLGEINIGLLASLGFLNPMALQLDLFLTGAFGLGPFLADIQTQFSAALAAQVNIGLQLADPFAAVRALLTAVASLQAALQLAISFGLPVVSLQLSAQLSATVALTAALQLKIGGIKALIAGALAIKIPALQFIAQLQASLSAGPVHLLSFTGSSLSATGGQVAGQFSAGLGPDDPISPAELVSGLILLTKDPVVFAAIGAILKAA